MSTQNVQLHAVTPDGRIDVLQLAKLDEATTPVVSATKPLVLKSEPGFVYKLIDTDAGGHLKGQKLLRSQKSLKVLFGDTVALELQDYFVASVSPMPNRAVYKLENQTCEEVQVTSHLPNEAFSVPESLVWTDQEDATDCKVALLNPGTAMVFASIAPVAGGIGLLEVSGAALGLIALNGGNKDTQSPTLVSSALTSATGYLTSPADPSVKLLNASDTLTATISFSEAVTLNTSAGSPTLALVIGSTTVLATYVSGSGTNAFIFTTTIASGQTDTDGVAIAINALSLNGSTLKDAAGNNATTTAIAIAPNALFLVDTTSPTLTIGSDLADLKIGETAIITFTFSEDPGSSFIWNGTTGDVVVQGGALGAISGTGLTRTAVLTPTANLARDIASITVAADTYLDAAGNNGGAGTSSLISIDTLAPSVSIVSNVVKLKAGETANITFKFSEDPGSSFSWDGTTGDVIVTGGTLSAAIGTGLTRSAVFTPTGNLASGDANITVAQSSYTDSAGNSGSSGTSSRISIDTLAPSVNIASNVAALNAGDIATITFSFSEDPGSSFSWDGTTGDVLVTGGHLGAISGTGLTRIAVFSPSPNQASGSVSITVPANSYQDAAGNLGSAASLATINLDTQAPTLLSLALTSATGYLTSPADPSVKLLNASDTLTATISFSEAVTLNTSAGSPTLALVIGSTTVLATYVSGSGTNAFIFTTIIASGQTDTDGVAIAINALSLNGSTLKDESGNNANTSAMAVLNNPQYLVDTTAPIATLKSDTLTGDQSSTSSAIVKSNELGKAYLVPITKTIMSLNDLESLSNFISKNVQITSIQTETPISLIGLPVSVYNLFTVDLAGNISSISTNSLEITETPTPPTTPPSDKTHPSVLITSNVNQLKAGETANITFTFSEDPGSSFAWNGSAGDVIVSGGTLGAISGAGTTRTAVFTPTANLAIGTGSITVTANSYQDAAGNNGSTGVSPHIALDTLAPSISSLALSNSTGAVASPLDASVKLLNATDTLSATVTFSEAVTLNTTAGSPSLALVVGSSTVQATYVSGSGTTNLVFSTTIVSGQNDTDGVTIALNALSLNSATLKDSADNTSAITSIAVANNAQYLVDTTAPSVSITSNVASLKSGETASIKFTFSEDPGSSFVWASNAGDVVVSGGTLGNISGSGLTRTASFTPTANVVLGTANISVNAGTYTDAAGNTGDAGTATSLTYSTSTPTISQVGLTSSTGAVNNLLNSGDVILARVVFSEAVVLNSTLGSPTLGLTIGSTLVQAAYVSGSGSTDLVFGYTILAGQDDANGIAIPSAALTLNGSTLKSIAGNSVMLGNASVADNILYPVDTTAPSVVVTASAASLRSGETSLICFTFSEDPETSFSLTDITVKGGSLSELTGLGSVRRSTFTPTPNLDNGTSSITVANLSYNDTAGNLGTAGIAPSIKIDTLAPIINSVALSSATGSINNTLNSGDTLSVKATFNDAVWVNTDGGSPTLALLVGSSTVQATYVSGSGTNDLLFSITIVNGQTDIDGVAIPINALTLNGATLNDAHGNVSSILSTAETSNATYMVDTTAPKVAITSDVATLKVGTTATITFTFSEDPGISFAWDGKAGDVVVSGGSLSAISGKGLTRTAIFTPTTNQGSGSASITVTDNSYQDTADNSGAAGATPTLNLDTLAPIITSLTLTGSTGGLVSASDATVNNLNAGDTLSATINFNDLITVNTLGGTPYLALNVGGTAVQAAYVSGSGSNALVFTATVGNGQNDSNGVAIGADALNLNGGTLKDPSGNNSTLTSIEVTDNAHYLVDTIRPTAAVSSNTIALISGQTANITFTFSEDPGSSFVWNGTSGDLLVTGGTLSALSATGNPVTRTAVLTPASGVNAGTANVAIALNSYTDAAGNMGLEASAGVTDKSADISVNTTTTTLVSVALLSATGIQNSLLNQGDVVSVAVNFTEAVFLNANVGTPSLGLTIGSTVVSAQYASGAGTAQLVFNYTILNGQTDVNGIAINANSLSLNGKVLTDTAGNTPTLTFAAVSDNANYLVDTTAPTLLSIASSKNVFLSGETAVITFTFSEDPGSTFAWNGSAGDVTLVNGTLSALTGTGLTRRATFLPTQGFTGGNATITVSNNLYSDSAGNLGLGNTLDGLLLNTTPATLMDVQISSATGVQNNALNAGDVVTVTAHFSEAQTLNTTSGSPTVALQIGSSTVNATYATGAGTANLLFTYTIQAGQTDVNGIAIGANALSLNGSTLQDPRAGTTTLIAPGTPDNSGYTVDTTAPFLSITSNVGQLKIGETANITFTFSEDPGTTFVWNGSIGDVTLSNGTMSAISGAGTTRTAVFTPTPSLNSGTANISVSAGTYQDAAGNNGSAGGTPSLTLDTLAPTISSISLSSSIGILNTYLNEGDVANVSVAFNEVVNLNLASGSPSVALLIGHSTVQATYVSGAGTNTLVFTTTIAAGQNDADGIAIALNALSLNGAVITDAAANKAITSATAVASNSAYMVDTLAPSVSLAFDVASLKAGETATLTITANDKTGTSFTWNGTAGDLTVSGGTLSAISPFVLSGVNYVSTATFTPTAGSTVAGVVSTASAVYTDLAGNPGQAGASVSLSIDTSAPTLTNMNITGASGIVSNTLNAGDVVQITATFSESVIVNTSGGTPKVSLNVGGSADSASFASGSGTTDLLFNYTVAPGQNDSNGLSYAANALLLNGGTIKDSAGNSAVITAIARLDNAAYKVDTTAPTVAITSNITQLLVGQTANITFTFSEDPGSSFTWTGTAGDVAVTGGTLGAISGTLLMRTAVFTPTANLASGAASITVTSGSYQDTAGNLGTAGTTPSLSIDTLAPTVTASANSSSLLAGETTRVYFTFSEDPGTSFSWDGTVGDLLVTGGTLVPSTVPSQQIGVLRGFDFTPTANTNNGTASITMKTNSYQDAAGNVGGISNPITITYDTLAPSVTVTSNLSTVGMGQTANITFTFSEDPGVTFAWDGTTGDVVVTQGTLSAISGTGLTRTAVFTPFADTALVAASITVAAGNYTDTAGNAGRAGTSPTLNVNTFKNAIYLDDIANNIGGYTIESPNTSAYFGFAVSLAGDFNGDGYGDVVMGAPLNTFTDTALRTQGGGVVLYEGGQNTSLVPKGYSGTGQVNGHYYTYSVNKGWLGFSVAGVGDMNNDGLADLLIGMPQDGASSNPGGAFLVYGKANSSAGSLAEYQKDISALGTTPDALTMTSTFDTAGFSVSSAGDVNGDGWIDMIISAHFQTVSGLVGNTGKSYLVYGSLALSALQTISLGNVGGSVPGFVISGWQAGEESGTSVSSAGDFNGDGKADLLVSAYFNDIAGSQAGATYVILGKTGNTAVNLANIKNNSGGFVIVGENGQDMSGVSVSSGGDINGDGLGDILIGAVISGNANAHRESGKTYVIFGRSTANATIDLGQIAAGNGGFAILSTTALEQSGHSLSSAGDINGDGLADIILGAPFSPVDGGVSTGRSFVVYGKATTTNVNLTDVTNNIGGFAIIGQGSQDLSGFSVGAAGDLNGDGLADLIVGAPGYDVAHGSVQTGRSYIIFGSKSGAFAAGSAVDNVGTSANDTLTSTGTQTLAGGSFSAGTGNDTFIANGADVLLGGMGKDIFTVNASMMTALQNRWGAGGNTSQLAKIDGGAGIDTLRMGGTGGLGFDFSLISNTSVGNIEGASRINSVERIDLRTDTASNQITVRVADVLDMAGSNWANLNTLDTLGAGGWQNVSTGTSFSAAGVKYHQVAIDGTSVDRVNTSGWTLQTTGTVRDANAFVYDVYLATSNAPAMMLVQQDIVRFSIP